MQSITALRRRRQNVHIFLNIVIVNSNRFLYGERQTHPFTKYLQTAKISKVPDGEFGPKLAMELSFSNRMTSIKVNG